MTVLSSTSPPTIGERIFGGQIQYACPLALENCLEQLQRSSAPKTLTLFAGKKMFVTIVYVNRNTYRYLLHPVWRKYQFKLRDKLRGTLERIDAHTTSVTIDYRLNPLEQVVFAISMLSGLFLVALASGLLFLAYRSPYVEYIISAIIAGWGFDGLVFFFYVSQIRIYDKRPDTLCLPGTAHDLVTR